MAANVPFMILYWGTGLLALGLSLYGAVWLVRVVGELQAARTDLAELEIGRERLRVSRDLHDLLGQSLSAVSLKADLAVRLLRTDQEAAREQIEDLRGLARGALHDVRTLARDEHAVSLRAETDGAAALLAAAGIRASITVNLPGLPAPAEQVLAWAVREGVTNMLRHSDARTCSITGTREDGTARLEIVNDRARRRPAMALAWPAWPSAPGRCPGRHAAAAPATAGTGCWSRFPGSKRDPGAHRRGHAHDPRCPHGPAVPRRRYAGRR